MVAAVVRSSYVSHIRDDDVSIDILGQQVISLLLDKVRSAIASSDDGQPDWDRDVLDQIIEAWPITQSPADSDDEELYIILILVVLFLAYDILHHRFDNMTEQDNVFIVQSFDEYLVDRDVRAAIKSALDHEYERLTMLDADLQVLQALFILRSLLDEASESIANQAKTAAIDQGATVKQPTKDAIVTTVLEVPPFGFGLRDDDDTPSPAATFSPSGTLSPSMRASSRDVQVQYFLKPSSLLAIECVSSVDICDDMLTLRTWTGLRIGIEEGVTVSDISKPYDTVTIKAEGRSCYDLSATVIIPPSYMYTLDHVISIEKEEEMSGWTKVETMAGMVWIGNGSYRFDRVGSRLTVRNSC